MLLVLILVGCSEEKKKGRYYYPYHGTHVQCVDGTAWQMGAVRHRLKGPIPCTIIDPSTGETEFAIETDGVVFIVEK